MLWFSSLGFSASPASGASTTSRTASLRSCVGSSLRNLSGRQLARLVGGESRDQLDLARARCPTARVAPAPARTRGAARRRATPTCASEGRGELPMPGRLPSRAYRESPPLLHGRHPRDAQGGTGRFAHLLRQRHPTTTRRRAAQRLLLHGHVRPDE